MGNFLADFITNKEVAQLPDSYKQGIALHRNIDSFTDKHKVVLELNKIYHDRHHKYAPVLTDILFDYVLADQWGRYSGEELRDFTSNIYKVLTKHMVHIPERIQPTIRAMIEGDFLMGYSTKAGLEDTFHRIDRRTRFPSNFVKALDTLDERMPVLIDSFNAFFPDLIAEVDRFCTC